MKNANLSPLRLYIVPILVLLSIILLVPLVLMPQIQRIRDKNLELKGSSERLKMLETKLDALEQVDETDESQKLIEVEEAVPSGKDLAPFVVGVRRLAGQAKLTVVEMELKPGKVATQSATVSATKKLKAVAAKEAKEEDKDKINVSLGLKGNLADFEKFLKKIERAKRLLGVYSIEISQQKEDKKFKFDLGISVPLKELSSRGDIVAASLPEYTPFHQKVFDFIGDFINYTNVAVQKVKTGVKDPFK